MMIERAREADQAAATLIRMEESVPVDRSKPRKVLHILGRMHPGGAETRLLELMGQFRPEEFVVDVCALSGLEGSLDPAVRATGGQVIHLRLDAKFPLRFIQLLRRERYDVVHSHVLYASGPILALAKLAGVPIRIAHFHATEDGRQTTALRRLARESMRWSIGHYATHIIACGEGAMIGIWGTDWRADRKCSVVYDALDLTKFEIPVDRDRVRASLGIAPSSPMFIHVGREAADDQKNHRRLLQMFAAIVARQPQARLVLAGGGTDDPAGRTRTAVRELGLEAQVLPLGVRQDVPALMSAADAMLLPSRFEGLPGVVLEACATGLPVLASDLAGVREIADRLQLVRYLSLDASDAEWAEAALALPAEATRLRLRETALDAFRPTVFYLDVAVEAHRALWLNQYART